MDTWAQGHGAVRRICRCDVPRHVAVIMDGNGRWARRRGLPRHYGHSMGAKALRRTVETAGEIGVEYLTVYGFSTENWKRPASEVAVIMQLFRSYLRSEVAALHEADVRFRVIGERSDLPDDIAALIDQAEYLTSANSGMTLTAAISYGGRADILQAVQRIAEAVQAGEIGPGDVNEAVFSRYLLTNGLPDVDLLIRSSGEQRISNFLIWAVAKAHCRFLECLWPDFQAADLKAAVRDWSAQHECAAERK